MLLLSIAAFMGGVFAERYLHLADRIISAAKWVWSKINSY